MSLLTESVFSAVPLMGKKPRILISAFTFPPDNNGIANAAFTHATLMQRLGCEVDVITGGRTATRTECGGLMVSRFPVTGRGHLVSPHRGAIKELQLFLKKNRWDIIFMHAWEVWSTNCLLDFFSSASRPEKLILVSHGLSTDSNFHRIPFKWIRRFLWWPYRRFIVPKYLRLLTKLVVLWNHCDDDRFLDHKLAKHMGIRTSVIPNTSRYDPTNVKRPPLRFRDEEIARGFVLSVGNYSTRKNEIFVLDAYRRSQMTDVPLIFVGHKHNAYSVKIERLARKWNLGKVQICERLTKAEIDWLYKHALLFLSGSKTECQPLAIIDCFASGTACVSTDVGCVRSLSSVVVASDVDEMAVRMRFLLQNPAEREELVQRGRYLYEKEFHIYSVQDKWRLLLNELSNFQFGELGGVN